jgi:hypothetical protein
MAVTYAMWHDPSYWLEGVRPDFNIGRINRPLSVFAFVLGDILRRQAVFFLALAGLVALGWNRRMWSDVWRLVPLWLPALSGLAMYSVIHTQARYVFMFAALLSVAGLSLAARHAPKGPHWIRMSLIAVMMSALGIGLIRGVASVPHSEQPARVAVHVARALAGLGLEPGARVAIVRAGGSVYFARVGRFHVVAEIPSEEAAEYWSAPADVRRAVTGAVARTGAQAIVTAHTPPEAVKAEGWVRLGSTHWHVMLVGP